MKTLAIETSCDDTSLGIVTDINGIFEVEELIAYSQIKEHNVYGGVLPEIASRLHSEKIVRLLQTIGREKIQEVDMISVTTHPGLPGSLIVGKAVAHLLSAYFHKPLKEINHIHGHLCSLLLERSSDAFTFPMVVLTVSGGHNDLYLLTDHEDPSQQEGEKLGKRRMYKIGYTLDDAAGEAFDKVSKMLGGPYPGGPWISEQAKKSNGNPDYHFKRIFLPVKEEGIFEFSFSGMKSQVSFLLQQLEKEGKILTETMIQDIAYEFQQATIETLATRLFKAAQLYHATTIGMTGGVSANDQLIHYLQVQTVKYEYHLQKTYPGAKVQFLSPLKKVYSTDNAAMIGVVGLLE